MQHSTNIAYQPLPTASRETPSDEYGPLDTEHDVGDAIHTHEARHRKLQERQSVAMDKQMPH